MLLYSFLEKTYYLKLKTILFELHELKTYVKQNFNFRKKFTFDEFWRAIEILIIKIENNSTSSRNSN